MLLRTRFGRWGASVAMVPVLCLGQVWAAPAAKRLGQWQALITVKVEGGKRIQILDLKTGQAADLAQGPLRGEQPRVAPSRDSFYFLYREARPGPYATTLSLSDLRGNFRTLYQCPEGRDIMASAWWPDGHGILVVVAAHSRQGDGTLLTVTRAGQVSSLLSVPLSGGCAGFPDNRTVFLNIGYGRQALVDVRTGQTRDFDLVGGMGLVEPRWCRADGRLYTSAWAGYTPASQWSQYPNAAADDAKAFAATGIYSFKSDGTDLRRVPNVHGSRKRDGNRLDVKLVDVSPDGKYLLFSYLYGEGGLWVTDRAGKKIAPISGVGQTVDDASWSS